MSDAGTELGAAEINPQRARVKALLDRYHITLDPDIKLNNVSVIDQVDLEDPDKKLEDNYLLLGHFGRHEVGTTPARNFTAYDCRNNRKVVIKTAIADSPEEVTQFNQAFLDEVEKQSLSHPATTLQVLDVINISGMGHYEQVGLVLEYLDPKKRPSLKTYLQEHPEKMTPQVVGQLIETIARHVNIYRHTPNPEKGKTGFFHLDLKPDNIYLSLDDQGEVIPEKTILADFGQSQYLEDVATDSSISTLGTQGYMAPERALPSRSKKVLAERKRNIDFVVDEKSETYALGIIAFELLSHQPVTDTVNKWSVQLSMEIILADGLPEGRKQILRDLGISEDVIDIVSGSLRTHPADRPTPLGFADQFNQELNPGYSS